MAEEKIDPIKVLAQYFSGFMVQHYSISLGMRKAFTQSAREYFKVREALCIKGYMSADEVESQLRTMLSRAISDKKGNHIMAEQRETGYWWVQHNKTKEQLVAHVRDSFHGLGGERGENQITFTGNDTPYSEDELSNYTFIEKIKEPA